MLFEKTNINDPTNPNGISIQVEIRPKLEVEVINQKRTITEVVNLENGQTIKKEDHEK